MSQSQTFTVELTVYEWVGRKRPGRRLLESGGDDFDNDGPPLDRTREEELWETLKGQVQTLIASLDRVSPLRNPKWEIDVELRVETPRPDAVSEAVAYALSTSFHPGQRRATITALAADCLEGLLRRLSPHPVNPVSFPA